MTMGIATLLAIALLIVVNLFQGTEDPPEVVPQVSKTIALSGFDSNKAADTIRVGMQVKNIYDLSLPSQTFMVDGWYWLAWTDAVQKRLDSLGIEPSEIIEITNEIDQANNSYSLVLEEPLRISPELTHSYYVKFSKRLFLDEVPQRYAPFDSQRLPIDLEIMPGALSSPTSSGLLELQPFPVKDFPIAGEFTTMIGYRLSSAEWRRNIVYYSNPNKSYYSRASAVFTLSPEVPALFLKWLLPLAIVMTVVIFVPSIDSSLGDSRLAIPPAALLTLVILHGEYRANFPPAPYLTFLDKIYSYSYISCLLMFLIVLAGSNALSRLSGNAALEKAHAINRLEKLAHLGIVVGFVLETFLAWYL